MAQNCWENILVEWANCLRLSKSIDSVEELRDGEFYKSLINVIGLSIDDVNSVTVILGLLKKQYPNIAFNIKNVESWTDVPYKDLLSITSLLLHHTCIIDRREVLTSPLCNKLSQLTQLSIKLFLEKLDFNITNETLDEVINVCVAIIKEEAMSTFDSPLCTIYGNSSLNCKSPLEDLLIRTPKVKNSSCFEKIREIKHLKNDLEMERFEKADLQEELKLQQQRNDKLSKDLSIQVQENKKLRAEILALQNKTPPHFTDVDTIQNQRKLKAEIDNLESYISQLDKEQCDLEKRLAVETDKVKKLETECSFWQNKATSLETTNESLSEKLEQHLIETTNLRSHCEELSAILCELKAQEKSSDVSTYSTEGNRKSFGSTQTAEDLAQTVIDVQLKEVQKENNELRNSLQDELTKVQALSSELSEYKNKYEKLDVRCIELQECNIVLSQDLINSQEALETHERKLEEVSNVMNKFKYENAVLQETNVKLQEGRLLLCDELNECRMQKTLLQEELNELKNGYDILETNFGSKTELCHQLEIKLDNLREQFSEVTTRYNENSLELQEFKKQDASVTKHLKSLEFILFEKNDEHLSFENKDFIFTVLLENIKKHLQIYKNERELFNNEILQLKTQINELNEREKFAEQEKNRLVVDLKEVKCRNETLEKAQVGYELKVNDLETNIIEIIAHIQHLAEGAMGSKLDSEHCIVPYKQGILYLDKLKRILEEKEQKLSVFENDTKLSREKIEDMESEIYTKNHEIKTLNESLNIEVKLKTDLEDTLQNLQAELANSKSENEILNKRILKLTMEIGDIGDKYECTLLKMEVTKTEFTKMMNHLKEEICEYKGEIENLLARNADLKEQLDKTQFACETHEKMKLEQFEMYVQLKNEYDNILLVLNNLKEKITEEEIASKQKVAEMENKAKQLDAQNSELEVLRTEILHYMREINTLKDDKIKMLDKCTVLEKEIFNLKTQNEELRADVSKLNVVVQERESKINQLTVEKQTCTDEINDVLDERERYISEINEMQQIIAELNTNVAGLELKEIDYLENISELKEQLTETSDKYIESVQLQQELKADNEVQVTNLTQTLHDLVSKYNECENKYTLSLAQLNSSNELIDSLKAENIALKKSSSDHENNMKNHCEELIKLIKELSDAVGVSIHDNNIRITLNTLENSGNGHFASESYMQQCEENLKVLHTQLLTTLEVKATITKERDALQENINVLQNQKETSINEYMKIISDKELELKDSCIIIEKYQQQIDELTENQKQLQYDTEEWKKRFKKNEAVVKEYEKRLVDTKSAQETLENSRKILQQEYNILKEELKSQKAQLKEKEAEYSQEVCQLKLKLEALESEMKQTTEALQQKELHLQEINSKFEVSNEALDVLKEEQAKLERAWSIEKETLLEECKKVNNERQLKEESMQKYKTIAHELNEMTADKKKLERELETTIRDTGVIKYLVMEYKNMIKEKTETMNEMQLAILDSENMVVELSKTVTEQSSQLSVLKNEKETLKNNVKELELNIAQLEKSRDELLSYQTKIQQDAQKNLQDACKTSEEVRNELLQKIAHLEVSSSEFQEKCHELEELLNKEKESKIKLERKISNLELEKCKFDELFATLKQQFDVLEKNFFENDVDSVEELCNSETLINMINKVVKLTGRLVNFKEEIAVLENDKLKAELATKELTNELENVSSEKKQFINDIKELQQQLMRKSVENQNLKDSQDQLSLIKEAYEKLVEENNKLMTECDTLNYKRSRDREEYAKLLQNAKDENENKEIKTVREIRSEYEKKLEKMKEKMIKLYREEVDREMQKLASEKNENVYLMRNIEQLREHLKEANLKIHQLEIERDRAVDKIKLLQNNDLRISRESLHSLTSNDGNKTSRGARSNVAKPNMIYRGSNNSVAPLTKNLVTCKEGTKESRSGLLVRNNGMVSTGEIAVSRPTSVSSLPPDIGRDLAMEDEEDDFNNKYLSDLKEGRCTLPTERGCNAERISELAWRNSLCPPHLKSSYPAELQFASPGRFKEDEIKTGNIEFDDSMSTRLLPGEKPRNKKDIGTTSYKKPGPPTPSKNGGRLSLQGGEAKDLPLQEQNTEARTPKRVTPGRIKALFGGRHAISKENSENQPTTPRARRLSNLFRKAR